LNDSIATVSGPRFGSSRHIANIILTLIKHDTCFRSAMNIRFSEDIVEACRRAGLRISSFDRKNEPPRIKEHEGSSLEWGTQEVINKYGIPDIIFDNGDIGKEPMVRVIGKNPGDVAQKVLTIMKGV